MVVFGVADAGSRAHALDFAGTDHSGVAHIIVVFERAFDDVGDDFHLPVAVQREAAGGGTVSSLNTRRGPKFMFFGSW